MAVCSMNGIFSSIIISLRLSNIGKNAKNIYDDVKGISSLEATQFQWFLRQLTR